MPPDPPPAALEERSVRVLGHDVRVAERRGDPSRPPLVLCNGIGVSFELLQPFVDALEDRIGVVLFDVPGVGGSPTPKVPYRFSGLACFVTSMLDQLGHDEFDVLGISWGGGLAQQLAVQNPRRCRRAVLVSTGMGMLMVPGRVDVLSKMLTPRRHRDPGYARSIAPLLYGGRMREHPELLGYWSDHGLPLGSSTGYLLQLLAGIGWTSLPFLPLIRQPTLLLAGDDDPVIPLVNARLMARLLPHATLHVFEDGHLGLITSADQLGPMVSHYLR
jgi:poly(3-hydroxyalkanoate) depolymerase